MGGRDGKALLQTIHSLQFSTSELEQIHFAFRLGRSDQKARVPGTLSDHSGEADLKGIPYVCRFWCYCSPVQAEALRGADPTFKCL